MFLSRLESIQTVNPKKFSAMYYVFYPEIIIISSILFPHINSKVIKHNYSWACYRMYLLKTRSSYKRRIEIHLWINLFQRLSAAGVKNLLLDSPWKSVRHMCEPAFTFKRSTLFHFMNIHYKEELYFFYVVCEEKSCKPWKFACIIGTNLRPNPSNEKKKNKFYLADNFEHLIRNRSNPEGTVESRRKASKFRVI